MSNHRSIWDPIEFSMVAVDDDRAAVRSFDLLNVGILPVAGIYGPNASGKSNVVDALAWLSTAVARSLRAWDELIPREPFKFANGAAEPTSFEVEMEVDGVRYAYQLELTETAVLSEILYSYPERRRRMLFGREGLDLHFRRGLAGLSGTRELLTPTTLALSAAQRFNDPEIGPFARKLASILVLGRPRRAFAALRHYATERLFLDGPDPNQLELFVDEVRDEIWSPRSALALLQFADLGIESVAVANEPVDEALNSPARSRIRLVHRVGEQQVPFESRDESEGTLVWFKLIGPVLGALRSGRTILFDEIDASLHPRLSARLLELFQDPVTNPRNAQLIFTSHDTSLLNHLNRDEVWLTEKNGKGGTDLAALADFGGDAVRRSLNLERAYLQGRFGAIPEPDQNLLRAILGASVQDA